MWLRAGRPSVGYRQNDFINRAIARAVKNRDTKLVTAPTIYTKEAKPKEAKPKDEKSKEVLKGAAIYISDLKTGATTDKAGKYELENIKSGSYLLEISFKIKQLPFFYQIKSIVL